MSVKKFVSRVRRQQILEELAAQAKGLNTAQLKMAISWVEEEIQSKQAILNKRLEQVTAKQQGNEWDRLIEQANISKADFDSAFV